jgi:hypothetical protein
VGKTTYRFIYLLNVHYFFLLQIYRSNLQLQIIFFVFETIAIRQVKTGGFIGGLFTSGISFLSFLVKKAIL